MLFLAIQASSTTVQTSEDSSAVTAAKANRLRMKTPPSYKHEPDTVVPSDAQSRGEHGEAIVSGIINPDGHMTETKIKVSTRSARIDAAALDAAHEAVFEPARDAAGSPIAVYISVGFNFDNAASLDGKAMTTYRCRQFLTDQAWWRSTWPEKPRDKFGNLLAGMIISGAGAQPEALKNAAARFDVAWKATLDRCGREPDAFVMKVFWKAAG